MKSNKVIHHPGYDANSFSTVEDEPEALKEPVTADDITSDATALFAVRRHLRNVPDLYDWSMVPSSSGQGASNLTKWDTMLSDMRSTYGAYAASLYVPPGNWWFDGRLNIDFTLNVYGDSISSSVLVMNHNDIGVYANGKYAVGGSLRNVTVYNASGSAAAAGVYLNAEADGYSPDFFRVDNVNISGDNLYSYGLVADGNSRGDALYTGALSATPGANIITVAGTPWTTNQWASWVSASHSGRPAVKMTSGVASGQVRVIQSNTANTATLDSAFTGAASGDTFRIEAYLHGIRDQMITNLYVFQTTVRGLELRRVRGFSGDNYQLYSTGGNNDIYITSAGTTEISTSINISGALGGSLVIDKTQYFNVGGVFAGNNNNIAASADFGIVQASDGSTWTSLSATTLGYV